MTPARDRITVAHVVWSLEVGGLERVVTDVVRRIDGERFDSVVCCLTTAGTFAETLPSGCPVVSMNKKPGRSWLLPLRLARVLRRHGVDVVHAHNFGPTLYATAAARGAGLRGVMCTLHGPEASERGDYGRFDRLRRIDRVVAVSEHVRAVVIERGGLAADRVVTIRNGIDGSLYGAGSREEARRALGVGDEERVIGAVARLTPEKDHATLIAAFERVARSHADARLVLVGDGALRATLEAQVEGLGLSSRTRFLGTRTDIPDVLRALDVFVLPSKVEGLGITLLEAMAAGLPTVATDAGGIPELVAPETTRVVPIGDVEAMAAAMAWVLDHPAEARAMGEAGRRHVAAHFGVEAMVARYQALYAELAGGNIK
jgi:sugar transferase (PEP-CTERM/EpsH1 system associated)